MAETQVEFELVSPEKLLLSKSAEMVVVPGEEGDFGVLPRHSPMISGVRPGIIQVYEAGQVTDRIFVAGGFAEVTPARCTVLAEHAMPVGDIDRAKVEQELKNLRDDLVDVKSDDDRAKVEQKIAVAEAMIQAVA
ncbi:MAG: F0F1 ATP synthase subunit epsilon [Pseudomonadota bacterium]